MAVDNWPIIPPLVYVFSHDIAEQITRASTQYPYSTPKASSIERLGDLLGETSILRKEVRLADLQTHPALRLLIKVYSRDSSGSECASSTTRASRPSTS